MKAILLAAGFGTRLQPLTDDLPKALMPICNFSIIKYNLFLLRHYGITEVVINLHHLGKVLEAELGNGKKFGMNITYSHEAEILGTGGGIKKAATYLDNKTFLVLNSDTIIDLNLDRLLAFHKEKGSCATMVLRQNKDCETYGVIGLDLQSKICKFIDKFSNGEKVETKTMFTGIHMLEPEILEYIPPDTFCCINQYVYPKLLSNNIPTYGYINDGFWSDVGTIESYFKTNIDFLQNQIKLSYINPLDQYKYCPQKEIEQVIRIGDDVKMGQGVELYPPLLIGDGCKISDNVRLGPFTIIGEGCNLSQKVKVTNSILYKNSKIESGCQIDRKIIVKKQRVGA